jgi:hypothetical protein
LLAKRETWYTNDIRMGGDEIYHKILYELHFTLDSRPRQLEIFYIHETNSVKLQTIKVRSKWN